MTALWTSEAIAAATNGSASAPFVVSGVSIDSRTLVPGDLFIALPGPNFDGHDHVGEAAARGAAGALVARSLPPPAPQILVDDTHRALVALGRAGRDRAAAQVVAITGSVGKTGTRALCAKALETMGSVHASTASFNNRIGLPLTLARLDPAANFSVLEMGMNRARQISALTRIARPDIAVITTIAPAHLEFFTGLDAIAAAKAEIFEGVPPGGAAVLDRDHACFPKLAAAARACGLSRVLGFGKSPESDVRLIECAAGPSGSRIRASVAGKEVVYALRIPGCHWAYNSLAVLAVVHGLGGDPAPAAAALEALDAPPGRGRRFPTALAGGGRACVIDDAWNANPASMTAALDLLALVPPGGRRIAVLGDMLELGAAGEAMHAALAGDVERAGVDLVFTAGPLMAALHHALPAARRGGHAEHACALAPLVRAALCPNDTVLVKGSHGAAMHRVVAALEADAVNGGEEEERHAL